jgi:hypothetical protein
MLLAQGFGLAHLSDPEAASTWRPLQKGPAPQSGPSKLMHIPQTAHAAPEKSRSPAALSLAPVALAAASASAQVTPRLVSREVHEFSFHLHECEVTSQDYLLNLQASLLQHEGSSSGQHSGRILLGALSVHECNTSRHWPHSHVQRRRPIT